MQEQTLTVGKLEWFYREATPMQESDRPPVVLLHGLVSQSYSWREVLPALAEKGFRAIAPDWIGSGRSGKPEPLDFAYTAESFITVLGDWLDAMALEKFSLVVQGFLGSVGLQYALRHPDRLERIAILNAPLTPQSRLPFRVQQIGWPFIGDMMAQDPLLVDRTLEGGGGYQVADADLDVYRRPFLTSSIAGRALKATINGLQLDKATTEIQTGFAQWEKPVLVAWGDRDPWLPLEQAQAFVKLLRDGKLSTLVEVGHYPQEDWHEKVNEALVPFLRAMTIA